ncbi:MAG: YlxR family protein [Firmicutes bacterium]|nr:YlxR family protein [Bacillota bacterium]
MAKTKKVPLRRCVGCQEMRPKKELLRVVRTPEGEILVDPTGKKSGRGAYICRSPECLQAAIKGKRLERDLGHPIPEAVLEQLKVTVQTAVQP